jgi:hypothetical protein
MLQLSPSPEVLTVYLKNNEVWARYLPQNAEKILLRRQQSIHRFRKHTFCCCNIVIEFKTGAQILEGMPHRWRP